MAELAASDERPHSLEAPQNFVPRLRGSRGPAIIAARFFLSPRESGMARKKKGSGKPGKKTAGKKASSRTGAKRKSGSRPSAKPGGKAKKKARAKAVTRKKAAKKSAPRKAAGKKVPARKKATAKSQAATRKPAPRPVRKATAKKVRAPGRDKAFFDHFRNKLLEQRQQITRRLDELREELQGIEETPRELEEWAQEEKDRDILIRLEDRETEELRKIQAALGLIDQKEYGYCQVCGKPIPRARLEELPTAFRCVDCTP